MIAGPARADGAVLLVVATAVPLAVTARETWSVGLGAMVGGLVVALVSATTLVWALARHGPEGIALGLLAVGVATSSWNAVTIGPVPVSHAALSLAGLAAVALAVGGRRPVGAPWWVWALGGSIALVCVLSLLWPPNRVAFASRFDSGLGAEILDRGLATVSVSETLQWLVAAVAVPLVVGVVVGGRADRVRRLADAWVLGATVNAAVALGDLFGVTRISPLLLGDVDYIGRQAALSVQPNHTALAVAMALPLATWRLTSARRPPVRAAVGAGIVVLACGLATTGSRAGLVAAVVGVLAIAVVDRRARRLVSAVGAVGVAAGAAALLIVPGILGTLGERLRVVNGLGAEGSDAIRARLAEQAVLDLDRAPVHGLGPAVANQAHSIYLQLLASGGMILLVGYVVAQCGFFLEAWGLRVLERGLAAALAVSGGVVLVAGVVSNQLTDVAVGIPFALVAGLWCTRVGVEPVQVAVPVEPRREEIPV